MSDSKLTLPYLLRRIAECSRLDLGTPGATTFIAGMGRSGTTWVTGLVNHDFSHRVLFEPFGPDNVRAASIFGPFPYLSPSDREPARTRAAENILSGRTPRGAVDRYHRGLVFRRRIVKEVRCNLMVGWLRSIRPDMPLVLVVRNPLAVAASWMRLGWGMVAGGDRLELDVILEQEPLLADFPMIRRVLPRVDRSNAFERLVFQWCLLHLVPLRQLRDGEAHVLSYEDLVPEPDTTIESLASYLHRSIDGASRARMEYVLGDDQLAPARQCDGTRRPAERLEAGALESTGCTGSGDSRLVRA